jgi:DNA-binding transcriptional LysR family regulator
VAQSAAGRFFHTLAAATMASVTSLFLDDRNVDLVEAGIDVALRMGNLQNSLLTARKIGQNPRVVVGAPSYFAEAGEPASPAELVSHQGVVYDQRGGRARRVLQDRHLPPIDLWAVFPSGRNVSTKARAFANFIEQELGTTSSRSDGDIDSASVDQARGVA